MLAGYKLHGVWVGKVHTSSPKDTFSFVIFQLGLDPLSTWEPLVSRADVHMTSITPGRQQSKTS